jgi:hypothetical protein
MQEDTREQSTKETDQRVVSAVNTTNKGGRPTLYTPETVDRLLSALADGLNQKQACIASGISESTLSNWKEQHPELQERLASAREQARQKALATIKAAGEAGDWRASEAFLRMSFYKDYRRDNNTSVEVNTAVQTAGVVCDQAMLKRIRELREQLQAQPLPASAEPRKMEASVPVALPAQETKLQDATGMGNAAPLTNGEEKNAASTGDDKSAVAASQPDPVYQRAESWAEDR